MLDFWNFNDFKYFPKQLKVSSYANWSAYVKEGTNTLLKKDDIRYTTANVIKLAQAIFPSSISKTETSEPKLYLVHVFTRALNTVY